MSDLPNCPQCGSEYTYDDGNVFVTNWRTHSISKIAPDGRHVAQWGGWGNKPGQLKYPQDIAVDHEGNIYIADSNNHRVRVVGV